MDHILEHILTHSLLTHLDPLNIVVWIYDTLGDNFRINHDFIKFLMELLVIFLVIVS